MDESSKDKDDMTSKQKESEDYLNDVQIALDQNHRFRNIKKNIFYCLCHPWSEYFVIVF